MKKESAIVQVGLAGAAGRICLLGLAFQILLSACAVAQSSQASTNQQTQLMDRQKEIALALSACPPTVATKAAVYVLHTHPLGHHAVRAPGSNVTFPPLTRDGSCSLKRGSMRTEPVICSPGAWRDGWEPLRVIVIVGGF
jgi:hypothetical protein